MYEKRCATYFNGIPAKWMDMAYPPDTAQHVYDKITREDSQILNIDLFLHP